MSLSALGSDPVAWGIVDFDIFYELVPGKCSREKLLMLIKYICTGDTCINEYYLTMEQYLLICLVLEGDDWLAHTHKEDPSVGAPFKYSNGGYHKQKKLTLQNIAHLTSALPTFSTTDCIISL